MPIGYNRELDALRPGPPKQTKMTDVKRWLVLWALATVTCGGLILVTSIVMSWIKAV